MWRRIALVILIAGAFSGAMYTTVGCGASTPSEPSNVALVTGTVRNIVSGAPVANATITATQGDHQTAQISQPNGSYGLQAPLGENRIDVTASGFKPFAGTITVQSGTNRFDINLQPAQ